METKVKNLLQLDHLEQLDTILSSWPKRNKFNNLYILIILFTINSKIKKQRHHGICAEGLISIFINIVEFLSYL